MKRGFAWLPLLVVSLFAGAQESRGPTPQAGNGAAKAPLVDAFGDPLPPGALARFGSARLRHLGDIGLLAFSNDGRHLASLGGDQILYLWEADTGREVRRLDLPGIDLVAPQQHFMNLQFQMRFRRMQNNVPPIGVFLSPDGKTLAAVSGASLRVWETLKGKELRRLAFKDAVPRAVTLSPNGKWLAAGDQNDGGETFVRLWELASGREIHQLKLPGARVVSRLVFSPDSTLLAAADNNEVRVWEVAGGKRFRLYQGHQHGLTGLAFSDDGKRLASVSQDSIRLWDVASEEEIGHIDGKEMGFTTMALAPNGGTIASAGSDGILRLWNAANGKGLWQVADLPASVLAFAPDCQTIAVGDAGGTIRLLDFKTGKQRWPAAQAGKVVPASYCAPSQLVALTEDNGVQFLDPAGGRRLLRFDPPTGKIGLAAVHPTGKNLALSGADGHIRLWHVESKKDLFRLKGHADGVSAMAFSNNGSLLASTGADQSLRVWKVATGKELFQAPLTSLGGSDPELRWLVQLNGMNQLTFLAEAKCLVFSPDDRLLATLTTGPAVFLWETATGNVRTRFRVNQNGISCLAFSPDARLIATGSSDESIRLWDTASGKLVRGFLGHQGDVHDVAFSPKGALLASAGEDGTIRLWDLATGKELRRFRGHRGGVVSLLFSPDGLNLVSSGKDSTTLVWDVLAPLPPPGPQTLSPQGNARLEILWAKLAQSDAAEAHQAIAEAIQMGNQAVAFLNTRLQPVAIVKQEHIAQLIADLDDTRFAVRQQAGRELEKLEGQALRALEKGLSTPRSAESGKRLKALVEKVTGPLTFPDTLRAVRAVEILERLATPKARRILEDLSRGAPAARLTREASDALLRLNRHGGR